jgi:DNA polymerase III subunit delta
VTTPEEAARFLGMRSVYPARKAIDQTKKLGPARIGRAVTLLAEADLDMRGLSGLPDETVLQVLVGRLSRLATPRQGTTRAARTSRQPV